MTADGELRNDAEDAALAAIVRSSQDAVIAKSTDGLVTAWNDGATAVYGYRPEDILGLNIDVTFPPESAAEELERHARVAAGVGESGYRCLRLRRDGRRVEVVMSMHPVRDASGAVVGVASISRPVSEAERVSERFAALLEAAPDAMICVDDSARITVANAQVTALFGYERDELLGLPIEVLVPEAARGVHVRHRDGFIAAPQARPMGSGLPLSAQRHDGTTFPAEVSLSASGEGKERLVIAAVRDVTEQRAVEAALRESEVRLRQLADNVETVFTLRQISPAAYLFISPGFERLTGYSVEEAYAEPDLVFDTIVHPEDRAEAERRLRDNSGGASSEHRIVRKDGTVRWVRAVANVVPNAAGAPERLVGMTDDITERVMATQALAAAEAEARAANDAKNEFLSRMSHELRTPLNAVLGFGQLLEMELDETEQLDSVQHVLRAGRHLLALINDVLDIARIEAGEMSFSLEPVPVEEIVDGVRRLMLPIADNAGVVLQQESGDPCFVVADAQRLRQILLNLVGNAVKYSRPGGRVWMSWRLASGRVAIDVGDDGPGIDPQLQPRLFTPFDRLGAEATSVEGTGVGLAVSRGLAELMAGQVSCRSELGAGSVFTVTLPAAEPPADMVSESRTTAHRGAAGRGVRSRTVLFIEDNVANVQLMESVVSLRPEWTMVHAALGRLGLELARAHPPDLVLLDLHLPDGSGLDVVLGLRDDPDTAGVPVVVLSADANRASVRALTDAGAAKYLTKPLDLDEVLRVLDDAATAHGEEGM
jgi:PAS domain S-box-containing protein